MKIEPIKRDRDGLAETRFCRETPDGALIITFRANTPPYELEAKNLLDTESFASTWYHLTQKNWFTAEIAADVVNVVTAHWLAKARGWLGESSPGTKS